MLWLCLLIARHWFLIALAAALAAGFWGAELLAPIANSREFRYSVVASVLLLMGLPLHPESIVRSVRKPVAWSLAVLINAAVVPLLAFAAAFALSPAMSGGLIVVAVIPCTLASASVWTRKAGGDDSVAMMVTVVTNLLCFAVAPFWLTVLLGQRIQIDFSDQAAKLALLVALPLLVAQLLRRMGCGVWADRHKKPLGMLAQIGILVMVMVGASQTAQRLQASGAGPWDWPDTLLMVVLAVGVHLAAMALGVGIARGLHLQRAEQIAVGIAGSQKTLMVGLQIAIDCGVSMLPMIVYHIGQLLVDTLVAQRWAGQQACLSAGPSQTPVSQTPVSQTPVSQTPVSETPVSRAALPAQDGGDHAHADQ